MPLPNVCPFCRRHAVRLFAFIHMKLRHADWSLEILLNLKLLRHHRSFNSARRRADAACNSSSRGPFRAPIGSLESTRSRAARRRGPFLRTPLSSRVGTGPPVLSFSSAVFVCGIPRSECVICRVPLFHRHDHTPHYDSAIRQPALFLPQVAGAAQEPRARFATNTIHLLFCILGRSRYVEPAE